MRVVTVDGRRLAELAGDMAGTIVRTCPGGFDLMTGIWRGGSYVADALWAALPEGYCRLRHDVAMQRASTKRKGGMFRKVMSCLPVPVLDFLRIAEARVLRLSGSNRAPRDIDRDPVPLGETPCLPPAPRILVVDDAIDSGHTLKAVTDALARVYPGATFTTAVITVTIPDPVADADFCVYHDGTLVRFPWSADYRERK